MRGVTRWLVPVELLTVGCIIAEHPAWQGASDSTQSTSSGGEASTTSTTSPGESDDGTGTSTETSGGGDVEVCNGLDDDADGLVDEVSAENASCGGCSLEQFADHAYWFCPEAVDWASARARCLERGADLVAVRDQADNDFLTAHHPAEGGGFAATFWIGFNDLEVEGDWIWVDATVSDFTAWDSSEPNNVMGNEDCAQAWQKTSGTWGDLDCASTAAHVCWAAHVEP